MITYILIYSVNKLKLLISFFFTCLILPLGLENSNTTKRVRNLF